MHRIDTSFPRVRVRSCPGFQSVIHRFSGIHRRHSQNHSPFNVLAEEPEMVNLSRWGFDRVATFLLSLVFFPTFCRWSFMRRRSIYRRHAEEGPLRRLYLRYNSAWQHERFRILGYTRVYHLVHRVYGWWVEEHISWRVQTENGTMIFGCLRLRESQA